MGNWLLGNAVINVIFNNGAFLAELARTQLRMATWTSSIQTQANMVNVALRSALVVGGVGGGIGGLTGAAVAAGAWAERTEASFEVILRSARLATDLMRDLEELAVKTEFSMPGVAEAAKGLLAQGINLQEILPVMKTISDVTAALGGGQNRFDRIALALTQLRSAGNVNAQDMRQLTEAKVPAWDILAKGLNTSVAGAKKMVTNREVTSAEGFDILMKGMNNRFGGSSERMLKTASGAWSALKDEIWLMFKDIGEAMIPFVRDILAGLRTITQNIREYTKEWGQYGEYFRDSWAIHIALVGSYFLEWLSKQGALLAIHAAHWKDWVVYAGQVFMDGFTDMFAWLNTGFDYFVAIATNSLTFVKDKFNELFKGGPAAEWKTAEWKRPDTGNPLTPPNFDMEVDMAQGAVGAVFGVEQAELLKGLENIWLRIFEGKPEGEGPDDPADPGSMGKKGRKTEFMGLDELWKSRQKMIGGDPVVKAVQDAGRRQVAALDKSNKFLEEIAGNEGLALV